MSEFPTVDLSNCDREPIHILGHVQSFGCLLAVSSDWMIVHASSNTQDIIGKDSEDLIGLRFVDLFSEECVHFLRTRIQTLTQQSGTARIFQYDLLGCGKKYDIAVHRSGRHLVFEFEPTANATDNRDDTGLVQALITRVQRYDTVEKAANEAARGLQAITGIDRVMVYRFENDGSGTVIAEALNNGTESFLGLRYPASDIPKQARELYKRSLLRIISDVNDPTHKIIPEHSPAGDPLDLSLSVTRAVSPIHLEYLRNMGVNASMSVSILRNGELWGLFACHHNTPFHIDYQKRSAVELYAQLFNYELAQIETNRELADLDSARVLHDRLMSQISGGVTLLDAFDTFADEIASVIEHDGIVVYSNGTFRARGATPTSEEFMGLARFLNTAQGSEVYATDRIAQRYPKADGFADRAAGLLALPISRTPRDYLVLFRREIAQTVKWAGNPEKPVEHGPNGSRLTPRKSFEAWQEVVSGQSKPWRRRELRAADSLRITLLEVVLKLADEARESRKRAEEHQELLIAELNHRVRNILNLIQGLISQGQGDAFSVEDYSKVLDGRIQSLALAHDQLTEKDWGWVALSALIKTEVKAFLSSRSDSVRITGDDITLSPTAFSTMALVFHELVTNSAKYGALSDSSGCVNLHIQHNEDGSCSITWREIDGPPVKHPKRKGFGTTIIERSIPFELKGSAQTRYKITGFEADFVLPAAHVDKALPVAQTTEDSTDTNAEDIRLTGNALVLEDNMIISMDAADILDELGADRVTTASSVADAMRILDSEDISFALLDVNLGDELSLKVAKACEARKIPFALATGYEGSGETLSAFPETYVVRKPYTGEHIQKAVSAVLQSG